MARARNIKPGFFTNDDLGELDPLARLLFAGIWTIADREGRLEDRPKKIKAEVLPYDNCDADLYLSQLAERGFLIRYEVAGRRYIQVAAWKKHQNPHCKEAPSTIPAPDTPVQRDDQHRASTVLAPCNAPPLPERAGLIPDSGFRIPDSSIPGGMECEPAAEPAAPPRSRPSRKCPASFVVTAEMRQWAAQQHPGVSVDAETDAFRDHTFARSIVDWPGAWRNWMRKASGFIRASPQSRGGNPPDLEARNREIAQRWAMQHDDGVIDAAA